MNTYRSWWRHKTSIFRSFREGKGGFKLILAINTLSIFCEIPIRWIQHLTGHYSTMVQAMAWCRQATGHYMSQCWPKSLAPYGVTMPQWVNLDIANHLLHVVWICPGNGLVPIRQQAFNTLRPRQHGRHFPDDVFKCIFLNEIVWTSIQISLKFVPKGPIDNIPALFQIMAWRRPGDKPLSEPMLIILLTHICVTRPQWVNRTHDDKNKMFKKWLHVYKQ